MVKWIKKHWEVLSYLVFGVLCALLNMNMTTKEISEITRQSPHSINIARARLRSKFNLTGKTTSLQEFLSRYNP